MPGLHRSIKGNALAQLRRMFQIALQQEEATGSPKEHHYPELNRRSFLAQSAKAAAAIAAAGIYQSCAVPQPASQPSIAIIGAGIAGLHAAYILKKAGYKSYVYEGSPRVGGRIMSVNNMMGEGLWTEMGGEFIDSTHTEMINLASHFNLPLLDRMAPSEEGLAEFAYYFNGTHYQLPDVLEALRPYTVQIQKDINSLSEEISFKKHTAADIRLDNMSIMQYVDSLGITGWLRELIYTSYTCEYGMEATEQSAISFLAVFEPGDGSSYKLYGDSDERFSIIGGNLSLCEALAAELKDDLLPGHFLRSIKLNADKSYQLSFKITGAGNIGAKADILLIAIPFTVLREIDIQVPLPDWKRNVINNLGYGSNSKLFIGVNERVWRKQGYASYAFADNGLMNGYENTQMQNNNEGPGGYTIFPGGKAGIEVGNMDMEVAKKKYVQALDGVFPGAAAQFNNNFQLWSWPNYVFSKASYVSYKVGQYTTMAGSEFTPVDNMYFAGEHCSYAFQGFMNGGAETGRKAAEMIIAKLKSI
ncbi:flavin monoamine oxidase family protein [Limnovirga soli]|uniref:NAD(P)-binding protein n=1 Tax=Limnovirga soli TaxID=2656915 RepID=A0A8J8FKB6_9BACT|nr:NAD(P)/FAD-dependent oxidoreductase [Limnovirga soli]NNV56604.1 NAD(P)-binding protein [Limnovirga soli]